MIDLLLTNARVRSGARLERFTLTSLAIADGRIKEIGNSIQKGEAKQCLDLQGALALPGFVDAHTHLGWAGQAHWDVDWQDIRAHTAALERVRIAARRIERGFWLLGGDWSRDRLANAELPSLSELDRVTGDIPLFILSDDGSLAVANSRALALFGLDAHSVPPAGGEFEKDARGELTGKLKGTAARSRLTAGVVPPRDRFRQRAELRAALRVLAQHGITEAHDIATFPDHHPTPLVYEERSFTDASLFDDLEASAELPVRVGVRPSLKRWQDTSVEIKKRQSGLVTCRGVKLLLDSGLYSIPRPGASYSYRYPGFEKALEWMLFADRAGLQVSVHALGDLGVREALDLFERVQKLNPTWDRRQRLVHGRRIMPEDIKRIAQLGVIVEAQPWEMGDEAESLADDFDDEFLATAYPFRSLLDAGARVMFSSDWRMPQRPDQVDVDPLIGMYIAVTRTPPMNHGVPFQLQQGITLPEAIECYTRTPAWAEGAEQRRGALQAGMEADIVVLSKDIVENGIESLLETQVLFTIADGRVAYAREEAAERN
jgi:predicted amidohydrolase YtcJ